MTAAIANAARIAYATAGAATVTLESCRTGRHFTYQIQAPRKEKHRDLDADKRFVSVLSGENLYSYIGFVTNKTRGYRGKGEERDCPWRFVHAGRKAAADRKAPSVVAIAWFFRHPESAAINVYHAGRCGRCNRELTHPDSILSGLGPVCRGGVPQRSEIMD